MLRSISAQDLRGYASVEAAALRDGLGLSEWCRRVFLESAVREASELSDGIVLAELLSLRAVLLNVMFRLSRGAPISEDEMRQLIERADRDKHKRASAVLGASKDERR